MKTKTILIALLAMYAFNAYAQSDYSSYLTKAMDKVEAGDCEAAQKFYNVYKDLSGDSKPSVQDLIDDCKKENKTYSLGEKLGYRGGLTFYVAYLDSSKKHGLAVGKNGYSNKLTSSSMYCGEGHLVTLQELNKIIPNKNAIQISGNYWTSTVSKPSDKSYDIQYYVKNIETGNTMSVDCINDKNGKYWLLYVVEF